MIAQELAIISDTFQEKVRFLRTLIWIPRVEKYIPLGQWCWRSGWMTRISQGWETPRKCGLPG